MASLIELGKTHGLTPTAIEVRHRLDDNRTSMESFTRIEFAQATGIR
ncbi:hypothetical protein ACE10Z_23575 [Bradyrhizobium sp. Pha-3]